MPRLFAWIASVLLAVSVFATMPFPAFAQCRVTGDLPHIKIDPKALDELVSIGIARGEIFAAIKRTSLPESNGCWSGATGNFDDQLLSVGIAQWNFGTNSLQPLLSSYKVRFSSSAQFNEEIRRLSPVAGPILFSTGCLNKPVTSECRQRILDFHASPGRLNDGISREINGLFETDLMIQIQVDQFVRVLTSVREDLSRLFPGSTPTSRQIKWAIDTKIQQGTKGFPGDADVRRVREKLATWNVDQKRNGLQGILRWYEGLCLTLDQEGVRHDCSWNLNHWRPKLSTLDSEQIELAYLSHLRSRVASTRSGLYQALAFQRRAKIIFDGGSVHGRID